MQKWFIVIACVLGAAAVMLGAFGAHGLRARVGVEQLNVFETAVRYQFYHTLAILFVGLILSKWQHPLVSCAAWAFLLGILLFSGSLYLLSTKSLLGIEGWRWLGPVTPIGGLSFIAGWVMLMIGVLLSTK